MDRERITRRQFVQDGAIAAAAAAGALGGMPVVRADAQPTASDDAGTSQILNYNPDMEYRRQGSTGWMVSAVGLGGHAGSSQQERNEIVSRCIDIGINYIDACCRHEVMRDAEALKGRRDKMYLALSYCGKEVREEEYRTAKKLLGSLDELLLDSKQEYTDLWRITCFEPGGRHTFDTSQEIIEALETAKKQGKARAIGFSSHDRRWIQFMIEYFPQIDCVCFPFTTMSKRAPTDSLFPALEKCDVGAFGIKPFAAGSLFTGEQQEDDRRARLALRYILLSNTVIPIPGVHSIDHVDNLAKAVKERRELDAQEVTELERAGARMMARLPAHYQWLKNWQFV
jgi:aryl-alcohol dehydrogenase-like predicted oxidoreductase